MTSSIIDDGKIFYIHNLAFYMLSIIEDTNKIMNLDQVFGPWNHLNIKMHIASVILYPFKL